MEHQKKDR